MIAVIAGLIAAGADPGPARSAAVCAVGRLALRDLPSINHNRRFDSYYGGPDREYRGLLDICPELKAEIPAGYPLADDDARARAGVGAPVPGQHVREAFIYVGGIPRISSDRTMAVVRMGYSCTGLCGAGFEARYVRTARGWQRQGAIRMLFV